MILFLIEEKMKGDTIIMPKLFGIAAGSDVFAVVKAETKNEAFDLFAESQINDETFREEVDSEKDSEIVNDLEKGLYRKRMLSYGGLLKQKHKILNLDDAEDGNLINTSDEDAKLNLI